jgi:hypothetical protein
VQLLDLLHLLHQLLQDIVSELPQEALHLRRSLAYYAIAQLLYHLTTVCLVDYLQENVSELLKEASILGNVRHPNVVW